jgi:CubicO group peptidase (beta-lactamase class C family)
MRYIAAGLVPVVLALVFPGCRSANRMMDDALDARIANVESGVLPAVVVKGESSASFTIEGMMEKLSIPGVSVAVIDEGRLSWSRSYGLAHVGGESLEENSLLQAASVSKPVVAMGALSLVEEGRLDLDTDVNRYLRSGRVPENEFTREEKVTLRRLLGHTAGVVSFNHDDGAPAGEAPTLLQILNGEPPAHGTPVTIDLVPGTQRRYSNEGYAIIQQLLIDVTGKPFPEVMHDRVLGPLEMEHSTFEQPLPKEWLARAATGHIGDGQPVDGKGLVYTNMGAGGLWTTPSDLAKFALEIQQSLAGESNRILSREMTALMLEDPQSGSGLGLGIAGEGEGLRFGHHGHNYGFMCSFKALVRGGCGVAIMSNSNKAIPLLEGITLAVAAEYDWPGGPRPREIEPSALGEGELQAYTGRYVVGDDYFVTIGLAGGRLTITHFEGEDVLIPSSETLFYQQLDGIELTFVKDEEGNVTAISLMDGRLTLTRVNEEAEL